MSNAESTIVGLKAQDCPGGGWTGMPDDLERPTVGDCLGNDSCGCIYGEAIQHIMRMRVALETCLRYSSEIQSLDHEVAKLRAEIERLRAAASKAVRVWRREPSPNSEKIYDAMFALECALAGEQGKVG